MARENAPRHDGSQRDFDLVLFGATGFTGRLVADYLAGHPQQNELRWAIAGRNRSKLERVRDELSSGRPDIAPQVLIADSHDRAALDAITRRTAVLCSTVGPYAKHGSELVASAAAAGTDYCDLTGETQWIARMIDAHHVTAKETGARIVHCCGFDSIPSDLGTLMVQEAAEQRFGRPLSEVKLIVTDMKGGASGGTIASILNVLDEARRDPKLRRRIGHPYALNPEGERSGPDGSDLNGVRYEPAVQAWVGPFVMAAINTRVVRRTNAIRGYPYGRDFRYSEVMSFGKGPAACARAAAFAAGLAGFAVAASVPATRRLIERRLPSPGQGPDAEARRRGHFEVALIGTGTDSGGQPVELRGRVAGDSDPGYGETAKMLSESALCLALDRTSLSSEGGITTPASAMGTHLVERLRRAGMTFEVE